ncbi:tol-pal system protein YbgF [Marinicauda algicola]|uniref:Cell division coordinator CpoB n=1 Tax=Marinicauda algicola TaxID=2029849 RepID=A0A4S2H4K1_9PROT|nr:tol-pal system protein YbgF [Marinicauda algicola]TGY90463.1 tol-pal system protein YbgF [Marinicauda algicola]
MFRFAALLLLLAAGLSLAAPAGAQSRREMSERIDALEARLAEMEERFLAGDPVAEQLMVRVDALEREQRVLTGEVERLAFQNRQLRQELEALGGDLDAILAGGAVPSDSGPALLEPETGEPGADDDVAVVDPNDPFAEVRAEATRPLTLPGNAATGDRAAGTGRDTGARDLAEPSPAPLPEPAEMFTTGRNLLLDGDYGGAQELFARFTQAYPGDDLAGQAWYWLGETHFVQGDFQSAADSYLASLRAERSGPRAPDALVRLAASLAAMDQVAEACGVLENFDAEFPNADDEARRKARREAARAGC